MTVTYTKPDNDSMALRDRGGNQVESFEDFEVTNNPPLTGRLENVPANHNSPFTFEVHFSEELASTVTDVVMRDSVFTVTNGTVSAVRRLDPSSTLAWEITVDADDGEEATVVLPETTDCSATGAICTADGRPLTGELRFTVPPSEEETGNAVADALTGEFLELPERHGGDAFTFELRFTEEPANGFSYRILQGYGSQPSAFSVTNGRVHTARRLEQGKNRRWEVRIIPDSGAGDISVTLPATTDCTATGAICTEDDRPLSADVSATVPHTAQAPEQVVAPPPPDFRVRFENIPAEHDGTSALVFKVMFNKLPKAVYSYTHDAR